MLLPTEIGVLHGLAGRQPRLVVVAQELVQEVQGLSAHQVLVLAVHEALPSLAGMPAPEGKWEIPRAVLYPLRPTKGSDAREGSPLTHLPRMSLKRGSSSTLYLSI